MRRHPLGDGAKFHRLQERDQVLAVGLMHREFVGLLLQRHLVVQRHQLERDAGSFRILDQGFAALGLLDLARPGQQAFDIAVSVDQFGRRLDADAAHARHIVGGIAGQRLHLHHLVGGDAELLQHLRRGQAPVFHGVEQFDLAVHHQLHQILVGRDDGTAGARLARQSRIGGDQVVGLIALHLDTGDAEGAGRIAHQRELRDQVFGRGRAVRLVFLVDFVAEGLFAGVENHRQMGRLLRTFHVLQQLPQHVAVAGHRAGRQAVGLAGQRRKRVIGPEQVTGTINQIEVVALFQSGQ